jgi:hypothetical protein
MEPPTCSPPWRDLRAAAHHVKGEKRVGRVFRQDRAIVHARMER